MVYFNMYIIKFLNLHIIFKIENLRYKKQNSIIRHLLKILYKFYNNELIKVFK